MSEADSLRKIFSKISKDFSFTQGGGGNISVKNEEFIWVKSSGTKLSEINDKNIFSKLYLQKCKENISEDNFVFEDCLVSKDSLKPSIETALHVILESKYVFHLHAIGPIAQMIKHQNHKDFNQFLKDSYDVIFVDYFKPGEELAKELIKRINHNQPELIFLQNHGIIICSPDETHFNHIIKVIKDTFKCINRSDNDLYEVCNETTNFSSLRKLFRVFDKRFLNYVIKNYAFCPDNIVFFDKNLILKDKISDEFFLESEYFLTKNGDCFISSEMSQSSQEQLLFIIEVLANSYPSKISLLSEAQQDELINWDAEKYRKANLK